MKLDSKLTSVPFSKSMALLQDMMYGKTDLLPFFIADMDFETHKPIQEAINERVLNSGFAYEYRPDSYIEALINWYAKRYGIHFTRREIIFSPTIITSMGIIIDFYTNEGDSIAIQTPVYQEFEEVIKVADRKVVFNELIKKEDNAYTMNLEDLERQIITEGVRILVVCNPQNPVGKVWTKEELAKVVALCEKHKVLIISDEVHKDVVFEGSQFYSMYNFVDEYDQIVICTSEAKTFNLCSMTESICITKNRKIKMGIKRFLHRFNLERVNGLVRVALETAYKTGEEWVEELNKTIYKNVCIVQTDFEDTPVVVTPSEGTYQVWLDFSKVFKDDKEMFDAVINQGLALNRGIWYGPGGNLHMRMNIACTEDKLHEGIKRLKGLLPN